MSNATEIFCGGCGAQNLGTRFCEDCGQPAPGVGSLTSPPPPPAITQPPSTASGMAPSTPTYRRGSPLNGLVLGLYIISVALPLVVFFAMSNVFHNLNFDVLQIWSNVDIVFTVIAGIFAGVAALTSKSSASRRGVGAVFGFLFALVNPLPIFLNLNSLGWISMVIAVLTSITIFLSWGIARPFRGPGFAAIPIGVVLWLAAYLALPQLIQNLPFAGSIVTPFVFIVAIVIVPVGTVLCAMGFEKGGGSPRPQFYPLPVA